LQTYGCSRKKKEKEIIRIKDQNKKTIRMTRNSEGLQNSSQQYSEFYTEQQNLNNSHGQLLA
jgi:hypothetical protein